MKLPFFFILALTTFTITAQKPQYAVALIPANLKENANAVVRLEQTDIDITSRSTMTIHTLRVVTVLNELGLRHINASEDAQIKSIGAIVYDAFGAEIKKIKRKDFKEVSVSEGSLISDDKTTYLDYTPTEYPFTIAYESETSSYNTAFIPGWYPVNAFLVSVEKSTVKINSVPGLGLKFKEYNFENKPIVKDAKETSVSFTAENLPAVKNEQLSPSIDKLIPYVLFGLEKFSLEGVEGEAATWENFSAWNYNILLNGTDELTPETQNKIKSLVGNETDPMKKAQIVYQYMQDKTRYVSIQLGIGGWRPMKAKDVDRLGYGDCKALTNYTRALLNVVGVPSFYAVIYGNPQKQDLQPDFVSMQGNHIILAIPEGEKMNWLECTSQTLPFGFQGDFTDDRMALLVKPEGGKLVRTNIYKNTDNVSLGKGKYSIDENGKLQGSLQMVSKGIIYDTKLSIEKTSADDLANHYKEYFRNINNLDVSKIQIKNDRQKVELTEDIAIAATGYGSIANGRMIFALNAFSQFSAVPQRYRTRINPFEISRGFDNQDEITITLPEGFSIESRPENFEVTDVYGHYKTEYTVVDDKHILYKRTLLLNEGQFPASEYEKFRKFIELIARNDNAKIVLNKINN